MCCIFGCMFFQDTFSFLLRRPLWSYYTLGFDHTYSWPQSHLPLWQLCLGLRLPPSLFPAYISISSSFCSLTPQASSPPFPTAVTWKHFTLAPQLLTSTFRRFFYEASSTGLHLSGPNGNHRFSCTFGLSSTDKVLTCSGQYLWLVWFLFTLGAFGFILLCWEVFFSVLLHPCNSASLYLQYARVCMCVCLHDHVKPHPIDVSLSFLLSQRSTQLLQHPTVCIHFKGRRDWDSWAQTAEEPACGFSHSKTLTWMCVCVLYECQCVWVWESEWEWESWTYKFRHDVWHMKDVKENTPTQMQGHRVRCGVPQKGKVTQTRGRQQESGPEGCDWQPETTCTCVWHRTHIQPEPFIPAVIPVIVHTSLLKPCKTLYKKYGVGSCWKVAVFQGEASL